MDSMNTVSEKIKALKKEGYTEDFYFEDGNLKVEGKSYQASDIKVVNEFRYEGKTNPDDLSILYQLEASDGAKGTITDGYGPNANADLTQFILKAES